MINLVHFIIQIRKWWVMPLFKIKMKHGGTATLRHQVFSPCLSDFVTLCFRKVKNQIKSLPNCVNRPDRRVTTVSLNDTADRYQDSPDDKRKYSTCLDVVWLFFYDLSAFCKRDQYKNLYGYRRSARIPRVLQLYF